MAKRPSAAELKKQGEELAKTFAEMRKREHNFAMQIGKEGIVFLVDKRKPPEALWRIAKKEGGSSKGAMGTVTMQGKVMEFNCEDPKSAPTNLARLAKVHFSDRNQPARIIYKGQPDPEVEPEEEETPKAAAKPKEEEKPEAASETAKKDETTAATEAKDDSNPQESGNREEPANSQGSGNVEENGTEAPTPAAETPMEQGTGEAKSLLAEFDTLKADIAACATSENAGLAKKVSGLEKMFDANIATNPKKARGVLSLLKTTLETAKKAGHLDVAAPPTAPQPDPAAAQARRSKLAELEAGVDALLAEFA